MTADHPNPSHNDPIRWRRVRRYSLILLIVLWIATLGIIIHAYTNERWGSGMQFVISTVTFTFTGVLSLIWFVMLAPLRRSIRLGALVTVLAVGVLLVTSLRLEEVTGGLWPRFVPRWAAKSDERFQRLEAPKAATAPQIDLSASGENDFPMFLGPDQNQSIDGVQFATDWSNTPPRRVWRQPIGAGWSSFAAVNGHAVTQEQRGEQEVVTCYEIASGDLVWASPIETRHETKMGGIGPRSTPTIDESRVYVLGATGVFRCLDGSSGVELWRHDLLVETDVRDDLKAIAWGRAASPLIVGQNVIVPVGGPANGPKTSLIAYNKVTGEEVWRAGTHQVSYASPVQTTLLDRDQILIVLEDFVSSFDTHTGELIWEHKWPGRSNTNANVSNAVPLGTDRVFLSKGYGDGAELLKLAVNDQGHWDVESIWKKPVVMKTKLSNVVAFDGHIYGLDDVILECIDIDTGVKRWKRGRFGYGQLLRAGSTLIVMSEQGEVAAVEATSTSFIEHGRFEALEGKCWNTLCLYGPYLLVRNATEAACYELPEWSRNTSSLANLKSE